jgi:predicted component of type VI protein secretion system
MPLRLVARLVQRVGLIKVADLYEQALDLCESLAHGSHGVVLAFEPRLIVRAEVLVVLPIALANLRCGP